MEPFKLLDKAEPMLKYYYGTVLGIGLVSSIILVVAGFGLLKMRYWGRNLSIFYAVVGIIMALVGVGMNFAVVNPAMERWQKDLAKWTEEVSKNAAKKGGAAPGPAPAPAPMFGQGDPAMNAVSSIFGLALGLAYPCIVLYIMMLRRVRRAFAIANGDLPPERDEPEDYRDPGRDDFERDIRLPGTSRDRPDAPRGPDDDRFRARPE
jgi:hypothetical protein